MQCSVPKIGMLTLVPCAFLYGVQVNPSLVGEGIRDALKEGND
ncbi:hypothetical protein [Aeromonas hydrophila]|nr:hypothetical protein [Aeromonas hydrophila]MCR3950283.1 hypothetical protein [Aeromonas hydrophila]MCW4615129.1 hypothetical protein [Aeromonas hydrophila]